MSFGRHLQSLRLEKGISLETVSKQTRISLDNLLLLEKEDHANLPADVFNKGFIRAYAEVLNVASDEIIQRYIESRETFQASLQDEENLKRINTRFWPRLLLAGLLLALIVPLSVYLLNTWRHTSPDQSTPAASIHVANKRTAPPAAKTAAPHSPPAIDSTQLPTSPSEAVEAAPPVPKASNRANAVEPIATASSEPTDGAVKIQQPAAPVAQPAGDSLSSDQAGQSKVAATAVSTPDRVDTEPADSNQDTTELIEAKLNLRIEAIDETWMKVVIDSIDTREYMLKAGEIITLKAEDNYNLLIGNAAGLQMTLNQKPVAIPGKSGQVVTLQLP
jgi:cytoskeletal protein RodZ